MDILKRVALLSILLVSTASAEECDIRVNNKTDSPALVTIQREAHVDDKIVINPQRLLLLDMFYNGICHKDAYFVIYRNTTELYFTGVLATGSVFDINK